MVFTVCFLAMVGAALYLYVKGDKGMAFDLLILLFIALFISLYSGCAGKEQIKLSEGTYYVPGEYIIVDLTNSDPEEVYANIDALLTGLALPELVGVKE